MNVNPKVDTFISNAKNWQPELTQLRSILLTSGLTEELKWKVPIYTFEGKNVIGINGWKDACTLAFFKGALLKDSKELLTKPGENTQSGRWIKFTSVAAINKLKPTLISYIHEAIEIERTCIIVAQEKTYDYTVPEEFKTKLKSLPKLKAAFNALTPGRQRAYLLHFAAPKQSATRKSRIEKCTPQILAGKGLHDC